MQSFKYTLLRDTVNTPGRRDAYLRRGAGDVEASHSDSDVPTGRQLDGREAFPPALLSRSDLCLRIHEPEQGRLHGVLQRMAARRRRQQLQRMPERTTASGSHSAKGKSKPKKGGALRGASSKENGYSKAQRGLGGRRAAGLQLGGRHSPSIQRQSSLDSSESLHSSDDGGSEGSCELLCYGGSPGDSVFHFRRKRESGAGELQRCKWRVAIKNWLCLLEVEETGGRLGVARVVMGTKASKWERNLCQYPYRQGCF